VIRVIDLEKNLIQKSFIASKETVKEMLITQTHIFVAGVDPIIRSFNLLTGLKTDFIGHRGWVYCLFYHDGMLFSGGDDTTVKVWNPMTGKMLEDLTAHRNGVTSIAVCNN
jgi:WD40 repeat protein